MASMSQRPTLQIVRVDDITGDHIGDRRLNRVYRCFTANPGIYVDRRVPIHMFMAYCAGQSREMWRMLYEPLEMTLANAVLEAAG